MQYEISHRADLPDAQSLQQLLHAVDAAALVDRDPLTGSVRVSSVVAAEELLAALCDAGFALAPSDITRLPSECCGGCGG